MINCSGKLYNMVLCKSVVLGLKAFREQAGSQGGRGCIKDIVTLRLLIDLPRRKKLTPFIAFIDFTNAYDIVRRTVLF